MEFFTRVLSGNSRLIKERAREAEQINQTFKANLDNLERLLESVESEDVSALLDMVYDSSFPEEQVFMKTPSRARLKSKKELVFRLLIGLDSLGVPVMAEMLVFIKKHGPEEVADSLMTLLEYLSPLLEGKEAPDFSTDDVMDAMDFEWHSTSRVGSPLLNVIASATSSPRASAASIGDSPLHPILSASPYRRAISNRSMLVSQVHELRAKSVLDKTSTASMPLRPSLTMSASSQYPSVNQDFRFGQPTILEAPLEAPASPEIIQDSTDEKPSSYRLDTLPASAQHGLQRKHRRRKSSSLQQLFSENANDELSREGSVGSSTKRHSSSSSERRNSSELTKIITNFSETSSPVNLGFDAGDSREGASVHVALDKEFLSSIHTQDLHVNRSSRRGSRRISPSPPPVDEVALWREDSGGFSVDLVPSSRSAAQTIDVPPTNSVTVTDNNELSDDRHPDVPPTNSVTVTDNNELSDDQHPLHHVKTDEHLQELPSLEALNMRSTTWEDCADSTSSTLEASSFLKSLPMSELIREDEKKEDVQPPADVDLDNVSEPSAVAEHLKASDDQFEKLISELDAVDGGVVCESGSHPLNDNDHIHPQTSPQISVYGSAGQCSESEPARAQSPEAESTAAPFTGSGMRCGRSSKVVDANESRPLRDIRRSPAHFIERDSTYAGSFMVHNAADGHMHAGLMEDYENQQANHLSNVFPLAHKTDAPAADYNRLHGHPTSSSTVSHMEQSDQHVLTQPTTMVWWDMDTNVPRSKRKTNYMGKWARGCLSCGSQPHTNP